MYLSFSLGGYSPTHHLYKVFTPLPNYPSYMRKTRAWFSGKSASSDATNFMGLFVAASVGAAGGYVAGKRMGVQEGLLRSHEALGDLESAMGLHEESMGAYQKMMQRARDSEYERGYRDGQAEVPRRRSGRGEDEEVFGGTGVRPRLSDSNSQ